MHFPNFTTDVSQWPSWAIPTIGLVCTLLVLLVGYMIFGPGKPKLKLPPPQQIYTSDHDRRDQRSFMRRTGNPIDVLITDAKVSEPPRNGLVLDRSLRGLCLAVDSPYDQGSVLSVRPSTAPTTTPWVRVQVKNCREVGNNYELGCEFLQVPPASVLMLFG